MENLKCPHCGKPMVEVEMTGYYVLKGLSYIYKFKSMRCEDYPKEHFQTEAQMSENLDAMNAIKAQVKSKARQ